jgi:hypothetical protein
MVRVATPKCPMCGEASIVEMTGDQFEHLAESGHIQDLFPDWTPDQRELLITGTHKECWDQMFADEDTDDDGN